MFMNFMDYVNDAVMLMFSKGQLDRMNDALAGPRTSLAQSQGLTPVVTEPVALGDKPQSLAEAVASVAECGAGTERVFDGVSWVPIA